MRKAAIATAIYLCLGLVGLMLAEGIYSVSRWKKADRSMTYDLYRQIRLLADKPSVGLDATHALPVATRDQIEALIPTMISAGIGMGNVPYKELVTDRAAINMRDGEDCLLPKPSLRKTTAYLRTGEYDRFDPPSIFFDRDARMPAAVESLVSAYGMGRANFTSNAEGERITLPQVEAVRKVLVAGDSVAIGSMIDDSETIASQLQRTTSASAYVNLGVNGAEAKDIVCRLKHAAARYRGAIDGIIYVYSENDFKPGEPFGKPEEVVNWLKDFIARERIGEVTVVFAPYIYNIIPHLTRFGGSRGAEHGTYAAEAEALRTRALSAGFRYISLADIAREEAFAAGTDFAVFSLFVDHAHLSNRGTAALVRKLRANNGSL